MAVYKRDMVDINLETGNIHRSFLKHSIGYKDQQADHFGIRAYRNGEPVNLTGVSIQGIFMPPQGSPIAITSGNIVNYNEAEVVLPQACYNYDGQFTLAIKLVDPNNSVTGTMRIVDGMVDNTHVDGAVDPTGTAVPGYEEVLATYEQAIAAINKTVRFDAVQSLTDTQKATARGNISAPSVADLQAETTAREAADMAINNALDVIGEKVPNMYNADGVILGKNWAGEDAADRAYIQIPVTAGMTYTIIVPTNANIPQVAVVQLNSVPALLDSFYVTGGDRETFTAVTNCVSIRIQFEGSTTLSAANFENYNVYVFEGTEEYFSAVDKIARSKLPERKYIFIGDSYCEGYNPDGNVTGWGERLKTAMGLNNSNCIIKYKGGTGFYHVSDGKTFSTLLDEAGTGIDKNAITDIVVCGGWNDNTESVTNVYFNGVLPFATKVTNEYPNAILYVGMIGASNNADVRLRLQSVVLYAYQYGALRANYRYLNYVENALSESELATDGIHPNADGQVAITIAIKQALTTGSSGTKKIDATLSQSGVAADAQATGNAVGNEATARQNADALKVNISDIENDLTGTTAGKVLDARQGKVLDDKVSDVKSAFNNTFVKNDISASIEWEQGAIAGATLSNSNTRIRTKGFLSVKNFMEITVPSGKNIACYQYSSENLNSYLGTAGGWLPAGTHTIYSGVYYKFALKNTDESNIVPSDASTTKFESFVQTDTTLSIENKAADAKATGAIKSEIDGGSIKIVPTEVNASKSWGVSSGKVYLSDQSSWTASKKIDIGDFTDGTSVSIMASLSGAKTVAIIDENDNIIDYVNGNNASSKGYTEGATPVLVTFTKTSTTRYIVSSINNTYYTNPSLFTVYGTTKGIKNAYVRKLDLYKDGYIKNEYFHGLEINRTGFYKQSDKNLVTFDSFVAHSNINNNTGAYSVSGSSGNLNTVANETYIPVEAQTNYKFSVVDSSDSYAYAFTVYLFWYNSSKEYLGVNTNGSYTVMLGSEIKSPANAAYCRIKLNKTASTEQLAANVSHIQLEKGNKITPYENKYVIPSEYLESKEGSDDYDEKTDFLVNEGLSDFNLKQKNITSAIIANIASGTSRTASVIGNELLTGTTNVINRHKAKYSNIIRIGFITDTHKGGQRTTTYDPSYNISKFISACNSMCDIAVHGGDIITNYYDATYMPDLNAAKTAIANNVADFDGLTVPFLIAKGNHEVGVHTMTETETPETYTAGLYYGYDSETGAYYSVSSQAMFDEMVENGDTFYTDTKQYMTNEEYYNAALTGLPDSVVVGDETYGGYYYYDISNKVRVIIINDQYNDDGSIGVKSTQLTFIEGAFSDALSNNIGVVTVSHTVNGANAILAIVQEFIADGGKYIAHIHGHQHSDVYQNSGSFINIGSNWGTNKNMYVATEKGFSFDIFEVDIENSTLRQIRTGYWNDGKPRTEDCIYRTDTQKLIN